MKRKYKTAFIIPIKTKKFLGDYGWEFESSNRLSSKIKELLIKSFKLTLLESYQGVDSFVNDDIKMTIIYDNEKKIESIYFQVYGGQLTVLYDVFQSYKICQEAELFFPS